MSSSSRTHATVGRTAKRVTVKMNRELVDRLVNLQNTTTQRSFAAFVRSLIEEGVRVFHREMAASWQSLDVEAPLERYFRRQQQNHDAPWAASQVMYEIASMRDAQQESDTDAASVLSLEELIQACERHGPERVSKWLQRKATANPHFQARRQEEEEANEAEYHAAMADDGEYTFDPRESILRALNEEIASIDTSIDINEPQ